MKPRSFQTVAALAVLSIAFHCADGGNPAPVETVPAAPVIAPDYSEIVIPPNIAPLNFSIREPGTRYRVLIEAGDGSRIDLQTAGPEIRIPVKPWKRMLSRNRRKEMRVRVDVRSAAGKWVRYAPIRNFIAEEEIDSHLAYRLIEPQFRYWKRMGIYQRNLESFDERCILENGMTDGNCMNCHSFCNNSPDRMLFHMRTGDAAGTMLVSGRRAVKVNTNTAFNKPGAYPSWHPSGRLIAFSVNKLTQFFHGSGEIRDVLDWASDLILYHVASNTVSSHQSIADLDRMETFPAWSADGRFLYFCSAPKIEAFKSKEGYVAFENIRYCLINIGYDIEKDAWGERETVLSSEETGLSVVMPRPSPDGRFLLFCMAKYGSFPVYRPDSDLYLMDLRSGEIRKPDINSDRADTFHSWSKNGRWFVFSSKRIDGLCARPYFCHVDTAGHVSKPFVMPQKDPSFYRTFLKTYNVPELMDGPVTVRWHDLVSAAYDNGRGLNAKLDPRVNVDRTTGATPKAEAIGHATEE